jgi:hypothetical protein
MMELHLRAAGFLDPPLTARNNDKSNSQVQQDVSNSMLKNAKAAPVKQVKPPKQATMSTPAKQIMDMVKIIGAKEAT